MKPTQEQVIAWAREAGGEFFEGFAGSPNSIKFKEDQFQAAMNFAYATGRKDENAMNAELMEALMDIENDYPHLWAGKRAREALAKAEEK